MGVHVKEFAIVLHGKRKDTKGYHVYRVGEKLSGLIVIAGKISDVTGLKLVLAGRARSYWKELTDDTTKELQFQDEDKCLVLDLDLDIDESIKSRKEYAFDFTLPAGLPSSFDGLYGDITYSLTAVLEIGTRAAITRSVQHEFKLDGYLNLVDHPEVLEPLEINVTKHMLFGVGHLGLFAKLNKSGFLPGETADFDMRFTNECDNPIQVNLFLLRETAYKSGENKITHTEIVDTVQGPAVQPHTIQTWKGGLVKIPTTKDCTMIMSNCKIMEMQYRFLIEMDIPGPHMNLEGTIPIIIGTVALVNDKPEGEEVEPVSEEAHSSIDAESDETEESIGTPTPEEPANESEPESAAPDSGIEEEKPADKKPLKPGSSKFKARHQRAHTTINVFRPKPVRQILPTPKPETWTKPIEIPEAHYDTVTEENEAQTGQPVVQEQEKEQEAEIPEEKPVPPSPRPRRPKKPNSPPQDKQIPEIENQQKQKPTADSSKYTGIIPPKHKKSLPYPKFVDSPLFPKPVKKCLVNVFLVAENKLLEPIGWRIKKSKCCLEKVGGCCCHSRRYADAAPQAQMFVLPEPSVGWGQE